jgi:serine/threonine protein kinase
MVDSTPNASPDYPEIPGYKIIQLIGTGSVGSVFEAHDPEDRIFAVKVMRPTPFLKEQVLQDIVNGANVIKSIPDNNIVKVYKAGIHEGCYYVVMDYIRNGTLASIIDGNNSSMESKIRMALQISKSIAHIHSFGIIHGDLKPANILINADGIPLLNDFYYASGNRTATSLQGTPKYMSPEQAAGKFISSSTDIYTFGVIFYEMLTCKAPYPDNTTDNVRMLMSCIMNHDIIPPRKRNRKIHPRIASLIMKLISLNPEDRYHSMQEVSETIEGDMDRIRPLFTKLFEYIWKSQ